MSESSRLIEKTLGSTPAARAPLEALNELGYVFRAAKEEYEQEIWDIRISPEKYIKVRAEYNRLLLDMEIVDGIKQRISGLRAPDKGKLRFPRPAKAYGER